MQRAGGQLKTAAWISGNSIAKGRAALTSDCGIHFIVRFWPGFWIGFVLAVAIFLCWVFTL